MYDEWLDIPEYEGFYQINNEGQIKSVGRWITVSRSDGSIQERYIKSRIMKAKVDNRNGAYPSVGLSVEGVVSTKNVHELMRLSFCPEKIFKEYKDGNGRNLSLDNLIFVDEHVTSYNFPTKKLKEKDLTQALLKECFTYKEGKLFWKKRPSGHFSDLKSYRAFCSDMVGTESGYYNKRTDSKREDFGYWRVGLSLCGAHGHFKLHRLVFLYEKGYLPVLVDHKDGDQNNNYIANLREGTHNKNSYNKRLPVSNSTGYKGVSYSNCPKRWKSPYRASIEKDGYVFGLGSYTTAEEAAVAYNIAAELLFEDFASLNNTPYPREKFKRRGKFFLETYFQIKEGSFDWKSKSKRGR